MKTLLAVKREQFENIREVVGEFVFGPDYYPVLLTITKNSGGYHLHRYFFVGSTCEVSVDVQDGTLEQCVRHMSVWAANFDNRMKEMDK